MVDQVEEDLLPPQVWIRYILGLLDPTPWLLTVPGTSCIII